MKTMTALQRLRLTMSKGTWEITSGHCYEVRANSEEEALAIFYVSQGHMDVEDYPQFNITEEDLNDVNYLEANTVAEHIQTFD
jgi:hypothetical protein